MNLQALTQLWKSFFTGNRFDKPVLPIFLDSDNNAFFVSSTTPLPVTTIGGASGPDRETSTILYRVKTGQSFAGATSGDPILGILTIDTATNTLVSNTPVWFNGRTKSPLDNADVDTSKLEVVAANALTATELATITLSVKNFIQITAKQTINITGISAISAAVNAATTKVILTSTVNCWVNVGIGVTAEIGGSSFLVPAYTPFPDIAVIGGTTQIAVIADSINGKLSILESV